MTRPVTLIAAIGRNGAIGLRDGLPWRLPSDLRRFKALTMRVESAINLAV